MTENYLKYKKFAATFGRGGVDEGALGYAGSAISKERDALEEFYQVLEFEGFISVVGLFSLDIIGLRELAGAQEGWGLVMRDGELRPDTVNWNENWVVFGDRNGDALFYDKSDGSVHGSVGKRHNYRLADTLPAFFDALAASMDLESNEYNWETLDRIEEVLPQFLTDCRAVLSEYLDDQNVASFIDFFFG